MSGAGGQEGEPSPRRGLRELEVWLVGGGALTAATKSVCRVTRLAGEEDWRALLGDRRPDFVVVEGAERLTDLWAERLDELLSLCERERVPRFLWVAASRLDPRFGPPRRFSRLFSVDRGHVLGAPPVAGARSVSLLWPGTGVPIAAKPPPAGGGSPDPVVWMGGWRRDWPEEWRARLFAILAAARPHGLRIVDPAEPGALPAELRDCIDDSPSPDLRRHLRRARIAIATDPAGTTLRFAPPVAFDAMACGAAVVTPHRFAAMFDFSRGAWQRESWRDLVAVAGDRETAAAQIERLLGDLELHAETVETCERVVRYNHTHAHRIASLASAAGIRLVPDAAEDPAHS